MDPWVSLGDAGKQQRIPSKDTDEMKRALQGSMEQYVLMVPEVVRAAGLNSVCVLYLEDDEQGKKTGGEIQTPLQSLPDCSPPPLPPIRDSLYPLFIL